MATRTLTKTATPGVYRRGNSYMVRYWVRGEQRKRYARTYEEACDIKAAARTDVRRGEYRERSKVTVEAYAKEWLKTYTGRTTRGFRESTRAGYRRSVEKKIIPFFRKRAPLVTDVGPGDVRAFVAWLFDERKQKRKLNVSTVRGHVAALKVMLATAVEDDLIRHNPAAGVRISRPGAPVIEKDQAELRKAMDSAELERFLASCASEWRTFFRLLAMTGLRIGEAIELRWKDVDFGAKRLRVRRQFYEGTVAPPKSDTSRRDIPLSTGMARTLWPLQADPDELVFVGPRGLRVDRAWLWRKVLEPARKAAGLPWVSFHTFRHTCASMLFEKGGNAKQVQAWLGHTDPGFTLRTYIHLIGDGLGGADFLDEEKWAADGATMGPQKPRKSEQIATPAKGRKVA